MQLLRSAKFAILIAQHALEKVNSNALDVPQEGFCILINARKFALRDIMAIFHLNLVVSVMKVAQNAPAVLQISAPPVKEVTFWFLLRA